MDIDSTSASGGRLWHCSTILPDSMAAGSGKVIKKVGQTATRVRGERGSLAGQGDATGNCCVHVVFDHYDDVSIEMPASLDPCPWSRTCAGPRACRSIWPICICICTCCCKCTRAY